MVTNEGIDSEDLRKMPLPKLEVAVTFQFRKNHIKEDVERAINKQSSYSKIYDETKISQLTHKKIDGYIGFKFNEIESHNGEQLVKDVVDYLYLYKDNICEISNKFDCSKITIRTTFYLTSFNAPYLYFNNETIKKMAELNLSFDEGISFWNYTAFKNIINNIEYKE